MFQAALTVKCGSGHFEVTVTVADDLDNPTIQAEKTFLIKPAGDVEGLEST